MHNKLAAIYDLNYDLPVIAREEYRTWVSSFDLGNDVISEEEIFAIGCEYLAAYTNPKKDQETIRLVADLLTFLFVFDDVYGEFKGPEAAQAHTYAEYLQIIENRPLLQHAGPLHLALRDITSRVEKRYSRMDRFHGSISNYFEGCLFEARFRRTNKIPSLESYLEIREKCVGLYPVLTLLELDNPVPDAIFFDPKFNRIKQLATLIISAVNDLFSIEKEREQKELSNFIFVFESQGFSQAAAIEKTLELHGKLIAEFQEIRDLPRFAGIHAVSEITDGLWDWMQGNYRWSLQTRRYSQLGSVGAESRAPSSVDKKDFEDHKRSRPVEEFAANRQT